MDPDPKSYTKDFTSLTERFLFNFLISTYILWHTFPNTLCSKYDMMHIKVKQNRATRRVMKSDQLNFHSRSFLAALYVAIGKSLHFS